MTEDNITPAELIAEARDYEDPYGGELIRDLADALEAVTVERDELAADNAELIELKDTYKESMVKLHQGLEGLAAIPIDAITERLYSLSNDALKRIGDQCFYMIAERNADGVFS